MNKSVLYLYKGKIDKNGSAALQRAALRDYFGKDAVTERTETGKPLISEPKGFGFSVSHTGELFGCIVAPFDCGLDMEIEREGDFDRLKRQFLVEEGEFFPRWVRTEAFSKLTGGGIWSMKGKPLPDGVLFRDISEELRSFYGRRVHGVICSYTETAALEIKEIKE